MYTHMGRDTATSKFKLTPRAWLLLRLATVCGMFIVLGLLTMVLWFQQPLLPAVASDHSRNAVYQQIVVQPGDTLWGISSRLAQGQDHRTVLDQILAYNDLATSELEIGQTLYVPIIER